MRMEKNDVWWQSATHQVHPVYFSRTPAALSLLPEASAATGSDCLSDADRSVLSGAKLAAGQDDPLSKCKHLAVNPPPNVGSRQRNKLKEVRLKSDVISVKLVLQSVFFFFPHYITGSKQ